MEGCVFIGVEKLVKLILSYELFVHTCVGHELHATLSVGLSVSRFLSSYIEVEKI